MNLIDTLMSSLVDTAFPMPPTDTDFCRPDCYPPIPGFPMRPPLDMRQYSAPNQEDDHV